MSINQRQITFRNALIVVFSGVWVTIWAINFPQIASTIHAFNESIQAALNSLMPAADVAIQDLTDVDVGLFLIAVVCIYTTLASMIRNAWVGTGTH